LQIIGQFFALDWGASF